MTEVGRLVRLRSDISLEQIQRHLALLLSWVVRNARALGRDVIDDLEILVRVFQERHRNWRWGRNAHERRHRLQNRLECSRWPLAMMRST